jgi:SAM-dependent methyltransferase
MDPSIVRNISLLATVRRWWNDTVVREGRSAAVRQLVAAIWAFVRESTPEQRRRRYGDADYDWDYRVNTTSAAVGWHDRLLGIFHSAYQPTEPAAFHEMLDGMRERTGLYFPDFTFIDLGSGKGRTLLMASDYPFRRIVGVELLPALHRIAQQNASKYHNEAQKCFAVEAVCGDAREFVFPAEPLVLYLFNPLPEAGLRQVMANLEQSLRADPRTVYVVYHNPLLEHVVAQSTGLRKTGGTQQYAVYASLM